MRCSRASAIIVVLAACYSPTVHPGATCGEGSACPTPLVCSPATNTCELTAIPGGGTDAMPSDAADASGDAPDAQQGCGDQCVSNDLPTGAIDVTGGGTFMSDLNHANDDLPQHGCAQSGGNDVFYDVTLPAAQVYYLDTFQSDFDTTLRAFPGKACTALGPAQNPRCNDDACDDSDGASQLAVELPAGTSCIVVDQNDSSDPGDLVLHVVPAMRDGVVLSSSGSGTYSDTTCGKPSISGASCADTSQAGEVAHALLVCPGDQVVNADTCVDGADNIMYIQNTALHEEACNDDGPFCGSADPEDLRSSLQGVKVTGPGMIWIIVDGFGVKPNDTCGSYTLTYSIQ